MGCIGILSTVAGLAGLMLSGAWMSSNYRRTVQGCAPHVWKSPRSRRAMKRNTRTVLLGVATRAASNSRHFRVLLVACAAGGEAGEPGQPVAGVGGRGAAASAGGRGDRGTVCARRVFPGRGQGAGQVRDAARTSARRGVGDHGRGWARLLPGRVLPGGRGVRAGRDEWAARREARPAGPGQAHRADRGVSAIRAGGPVRGRACRRGHRPVRGGPAPAHRGTGPSAVSAPAPAPPGRRFWPAGEAAQADYEALRAHVLATGAPPDSLAAARFDRRGVAGLIAWPGAEPVFDAAVLGAARPPWSPHADPRLDALAAGFALLLGAVVDTTGGAAPTSPTIMIKELPG